MCRTVCCKNETDVTVHRGSKDKSSLAFFNLRPCYVQVRWSIVIVLVEIRRRFWLLFCWHNGLISWCRI